MPDLYTAQLISAELFLIIYQPDTAKDKPAVDVLLELRECYPRCGFGQLYPIIRQHVFKWNHKRVYRVYCTQKLNGLKHIRSSLNLYVFDSFPYSGTKTGVYIDEYKTMREQMLLSAK